MPASRLSARRSREGSPSSSTTAGLPASTCPRTSSRPGSTRTPASTSGTTTGTPAGTSSSPTRCSTTRSPRPSGRPSPRSSPPRCSRARSRASRGGSGGARRPGPACRSPRRRPIILMVGGLYPFLAGAAAGGAALVCVQRRWRIGFGLAVLATLGFSPLAFALLMAVLAAALLGQPRPGVALRHHRAAFAAVVAVFVVAVLLERAFPSGAWYPYDLTDAAIVFGFSLAGLYITGSSPRARSLRMLFACYLALNLVAFLLKGPIGSNSSRLFVIAGAPLLWLAANVSRERSRLVVLPAPRGGARAPGGAVRPRRLLVVGRPGQRGVLLEARRAPARDPRRPGAPRRGRRHPRPLGGVLPRQARHPAGARVVPPGRLPAERAALLGRPDGPRVPPVAALARRPLRPPVGRRARLQRDPRGGAPPLRRCGPRARRAYRALDDVSRSRIRPPS